MEKQKLSGLEFVDRLREKAKKTTMLDSVYFIIAGQETDDEEVETTSIVAVKQNTKRVLCAFNYDSSGLIIYNLVFGEISFLELCDLIDLVKSILDTYNF